MIEYIVKHFPVFDQQTGRQIHNQLKEIECVRVSIEPYLFRFCTDLDSRKEMSYHTKRGAYGKGAYEGNGLIGFLGEAAAGLYFGLVPEWSYNRAGDGGFDFILSGFKTDIKTARTPRHARNFIRRKEHGRGYPLESTVYIGGYIEDPETFTQEQCFVILIGYISKGLLEQQPLVQSKVLPCANTEMYFSSLSPIRNFLGQHKTYLKRTKGESL